ncbi:DDE transposase family protein, partial [Clostridium sporogenes]|nr:DDE transposase family protein [Clostridium sporogenes]NFS27188.1 DDE transposase family protein [Clostridium sporogenes]
MVKKKSNNYRKIKAWDEDNFEMSSLNIKIRFIKFIE